MIGFKKNRFKMVNPAPPSSEINVTPLVDVVLVLLIIFMVLTPLLEKEIEVRVPQTEEVETTAEVPQDQIVVGVDDKGVITINNQTVELEAFRAEIKKLLDTKAEKDRLVFFMANDKSNYGKLVAVLDQTKLAGATMLGMMTQIPEGVSPGAVGSPGVGMPGAPPPPTEGAGGSPPPTPP